MSSLHRYQIFPVKEFFFSFKRTNLRHFAIDPWKHIKSLFGLRAWRNASMCTTTRPNRDLLFSPFSFLLNGFTSWRPEFYSEETVNNQGLECLRFLNEVISDFDAVNSTHFHICASYFHFKYFAAFRPESIFWNDENQNDRIDLHGSQWIEHYPTAKGNQIRGVCDTWLVCTRCWNDRTGLALSIAHCGDSCIICTCVVSDCRKMRIYWYVGSIWESSWISPCLCNGHFKILTIKVLITLS